MVITDLIRVSMLRPSGTPRAKLAFARGTWHGALAVGITDLIRVSMLRPSGTLEACSLALTGLGAHSGSQLRCLTESTATKLAFARGTWRGTVHDRRNT